MLNLSIVSKKPECKLKDLMSWPAILTLINNLGTIGTWCSSPSHIIHPTCSSVVLPLFSFGALRSLGSSLTKMSLVFFRTRRAWEWLVFARLACFSWKQKDLLEKPCYFCLLGSTVKNGVFKNPSIILCGSSIVAQFFKALIASLIHYTLISWPSPPFVYYIVWWSAWGILGRH